jgi:thiamine biosynthesis protein ThiC
MTQILEARKGNITPEMEAVARAEGVGLDHVIEGVANGTIVAKMQDGFYHPARHRPRTADKNQRQHQHVQDECREE